MRFIYQIGIMFYGLVIRLASLFDEKACFWIKGRKNWRTQIVHKLTPFANQKKIWIHCASLGEFEQGRPVIELLKEQHPELIIILTFYSPSGYELRKNYPHADVICYLPLDTKKNAHDWIKLTNPSIALFVKYEFWPNMLLSLKEHQIPTLYFSTIFREKQHFFKWYGSWFKKALMSIDYFFVQQQKSIDLLNKININSCEIAGDTRFDRVHHIAKNIKPIPFIESFITDKPIIVAGSTWAEDEKLLARLMQQHPSSYKLIIAPHEIDEHHIQQIENQFNNCLRYSLATLETLKLADVLIIDNMGMLSTLYQYATITYIGGGFGKGIHNTLEAAVYGTPILFGPKFNKFQEAKDLINLKAAVSFSNYLELQQALINLSVLKNHTTAAKASKAYVEHNIGGTEKVLKWINDKLYANTTP